MKDFHNSRTSNGNKTFAKKKTSFLRSTPSPSQHIPIPFCGGEVQRGIGAYRGVGEGFAQAEMQNSGVGAEQRLGYASGKKQKKLVDMEGFVTHNLSNGKFRLKLENGVEVIGHLSGKIRQNRIKIVVGDKVTVELSPYDLTKGRITYRHR